MKDGIDQKAFAAEIRQLRPDARRRRMREVQLWVKETSRNAGKASLIGMAISLVALLLISIRLVWFPQLRGLSYISIVAMGAGALFNMRAIRRARKWRRMHPFEQWRAAQGPASVASLALKT